MGFKKISIIIMLSGIMLGLSSCSTLATDAASSLDTNVSSSEISITKTSNSQKFNSKIASRALVTAVPRIESITKYSSTFKNGKSKTYITAILNHEKDFSKAELKALSKSVLAQTNYSTNIVHLTLIDTSGMPIDVTNALDSLDKNITYEIDGQSVIFEIPTALKPV